MYPDKFTCGHSCTPAISKSGSKLMVTICNNFSISLPFQMVVWDTHALASISYSFPRKPTLLLKNNDQFQGTSPLPAAPPLYTGLPRAFLYWQEEPAKSQGELVWKEKLVICTSDLHSPLACSWMRETSSEKYTCILISRLKQDGLADQFCCLKYCCYPCPWVISPVVKV